jgi:SAM-dependent methyltransferase
MSAKSEERHGHMWLVGILGAAAGAALMIYVPSLKPVSNALFLFAGFHLVGAVVLLASLYAMAGPRVGSWIASPHARDKDSFDFGWTPAWTHGPWIAALTVAAVAVALQVALPELWPAAMLLTLLAAAFFAGGLLTRSVGRYNQAFLPMVDLVSSEDNLVLDAGCGAGRTTVALARSSKTLRVVALDRFDASYIEGGGRRLLEANLRRAGISERVRIECGDLTSLPLADSSFDAAVSAHAIDHLGAAKERGLREIARVLKPGGRFLLIVWVPGWSMFSVANVLSFTLSPKSAWRRMAANAGLDVSDEGIFNGNWFALLRKREA